MAPDAKLVKIKVGKHIPSLKAKPGDEIEVDADTARRFSARRMLHDQVLEDEAAKTAGKATRVAAEENASGEAQRRIIRGLESKLEAAKAEAAELRAEKAALQVALAAAEKRYEDAASESERKAAAKTASPTHAVKPGK